MHKILCKHFEKFYDNTLSILQPERKSPPQSSIIKQTGETILAQGSALVPEAEMFFRGDRGLFAYKPGEFLYWAGVAYRIQKTSDKKEYIFMNENKPMRIQIFESDDKKISYIHVGEVEDTAQGSKIPQERVLEALKMPESVLNLKEAKELFSQLQGSYHGDHKPPTDFMFREVSPGNLCLCPPERPPVPLQLGTVQK